MRYLKGVFHELVRQKGSEIVSGHMGLDYAHLCISILPKYAVVACLTMSFQAREYWVFEGQDG